MGNAAGKLSPCFCHAGDISCRREIAISVPPNPLDEGFGHSFCYLPPPETFSAETTPFLPAISGASVSANASTPLSTALFDPFFPVSAACFYSSLCFASVPLQPIPRHLSSPIERGFLSGPIERGFVSGPIDQSSSLENRGGPKTGDALFPQTSAKSNRKLSKWSSIRGVKDAILAAISKKTVMIQNDSVGRSTVTTCSISSSSSGSGDGDELSSQASLCDENGGDGLSSLQWAQGTAGEDRVHVVVSEENGTVFVGIYDGFNGPDATDFLLSNLYPTVCEELKGVVWSNNESSTSQRRFVSEESRNIVSWRRRGKMGVSDEHSGVLEALSEALRKTEEAYLNVADEMILENPVLSLMGSCVLVMLLVRDDVYLMNVGDSRAILAKNDDSNLFDNYPNFDHSGHLSALQLTTDHNTLVKEEVERIKGEHLDDHDAITNDRVKGSLKVTRAFGAGFLKNPKWNKGLLEMLKIDYVGSSPYITCSPSLHHHRLSPEDKFLILSSDGLYQYFTNEEAVTEVELFMSSTPEGDPAQHLIEEVLFRAAKKAGMDFHELLDIPQGERRRYHDDVSVIIMSFEGRIWRSSA